MSFRLLAIDTTGDRGSLALFIGDRVVEEVALNSPDGYAHVLFSEIQQLLARHSLTVNQLDGFASGSGPGSFTGVRVGLTAVKGLAEATDRKVVSVSNLEAISSFGATALRAAVMDARRGDIYGALYDASGTLIQPEVVTKFENWIQTLPPQAELVTYRFPLPPGVSNPFTPAPDALAGAIGTIAARRFSLGQAQDPAAIDANYVRRSDAELFWKES